MRRLVFALLLFVLPFQMVWAAAAPYCAHETTASASKHFGHHEHRHQAGGESSPATDDGGGSGTYHADCATCHLGCAATLPAPMPAATMLLSGEPPIGRASSYTSHVPSGPERPDRSDVFAAVRSGGDVISGPHTA